MRHFVGASLLLLFAGCTGAPPPAEQPAEPAPAKVTVAAKPLEAPPRHTPSATIKAETKPQTATVPPPRKPKINDDPDQLLRLDGQRVANLLGAASFVRRDGPAEVWQYRAEACVLDVYLYKEPGVLTVAHVDLRKRERATLPLRQCFRYILTRPK